MKKLALTLLSALFAFSAFAQPAKVDYSGKWTIDFAASKNLPFFYNDLATGNITVAQTAKELTVDLAFKAKNPEAPDLNQKFVYQLDGSPTQTELNVRGPKGLMQIPTTLTAKRDGAVLALRIASRFGDREFTMDERWTLSEDGKTLTVHRNDVSPMGPMEFDVVFRRV